MPWLGMATGVWVLFIGLVVLLLAFDLGILHGKSHEIGVRESLKLSAFFVSCGLLFTGVVWYIYYTTDPSLALDPHLSNVVDPEQRAWNAAELFLTGLLVEQSLSLDNIFVISLIFSYFAVPRRFQHRVLFWGILGVIMMRGIMIVAGAAILQQFHWVLYVFGAFFLFTGLKMLWTVGDEPDIGKNRFLIFMRRNMRVTEGLRGEHFFVWEAPGGKGTPLLHATPLFLCLAVIEFVDI